MGNVARVLRLLRRRRWWLLGALALIVAVVVVGLILAGRTGNISHPNEPFTVESTPPPAKPKAHAPPFVWPNYGYTANRTRYFPSTLQPPFRVVWSRGGGALLEFPPAIYGTTMYELDDNAVLTALATGSGHLRWQRSLGHLAAASPAVTASAVYAVVLERAPGVDAGRVVALRRSDGHLLWSRDLPSRAESSPLVDHGRLYFGSEDGTVYALRTGDGSVAWEAHANGAVKGGLSLHDGVLYFGDYGGVAHAIDEASGHQVWSSATNGAVFGFASGEFYATAAVEFGRVYMGNTDGRVYSFVARNGHLAWARQTGAYVYASSAVANVPGLGPTIYVGSYDGHLYALDARSGAVRWVYNAGGKISGSATLIGSVVYFSDLGDKTTTGLDVRTGRVRFHFGDGAFDPMISDGKRLYLDGYGSHYALAPVGAGPTG